MFWFAASAVCLVAAFVVLFVFGSDGSLVDAGLSAADLRDRAHARVDAARAAVDARDARDAEAAREARDAARWN